MLEKLRKWVNSPLNTVVVCHQPEKQSEFKYLLMRRLLPSLMSLVDLITSLRRALAFDSSASQAILMDFITGAILLEKDSDTPVPPASLSKLMTSYMVFEEIRRGGLS